MAGSPVSGARRRARRARHHRRHIPEEAANGDRIRPHRVNTMRDASVPFALEKASSRH